MKFRLAHLSCACLPHLAVFAWMLLAFAPQTTTFWGCEGKPCGDSAWTCCCASASPSQKTAGCGEANAHFAGAEHGAEIGPCELDCHCTPIVQSASPGLSSAHFSCASPAVFVLNAPFAPVFEAPQGLESSPSQPSRGPPRKPLCLAFAPRRGPPLA